MLKVEVAAHHCFNCGILEDVLCIYGSKNKLKLGVCYDCASIMITKLKKKQESLIATTDEMEKVQSSRGD